MKIGDRVKIKTDYGFWKEGHEGIIKAKKMKGIVFNGRRSFKIYDFGVQLNGDGFWSGFDKSEIEVIK